MLKKIKDWLYYYFAEKNWGVRREYGPYVDAHQEEHKKHRWKHWWLLVRLNWHYRVLRREEKLINDELNLCSSSGSSNWYLDRAESTVYKRTPPHQLAKGLLKYDVISFDIFDTLILRALEEPKDVFVLVGERLNCIDFASIRYKAEVEAREINFIKKGTREVTIEDIYTCVEKKTGISKEIGIETEINVEKDICVANPYMKCVFNILQSQRKKIVVCSDMYYPKSIMSELLNSCGYSDIGDIIVSCDYGTSKKSGELFYILRKKYGEKSQIVHLGDNLAADIHQAEKAGLITRYYKKCAEISKTFRENGMSPLARASYRGIVNLTIYNGSNTFSPAYEYGFIYGGFFVLGYVRWIHEQAKKDHVDKVLFLARDGYIYKKVYDLLYNDIPSEYAFWSRLSSLKYGNKFNLNDFFSRVLNRKVNENNTILSLIQDFGLEIVIPYLKDYGLEIDEMVHNGNKKQIELCLRSNINKINEANVQSELYAKLYYSSLIKNCSKIALVDTGWRGDNQYILKRLIEEKWDSRCSVLCYMAGSISAERNNSFILKENLKCYMFSAQKNRNLFDNFNKNSALNMALFELFSQAPHPSFKWFGNDGSLVFNYAEVENYEIINEILQGEYDFCQQYISSFKKYDYLLNISGYDAYIPFRGLIRNYSFAKVSVGMLKFQQSVGSGNKNTLCSINEIIDSYNV